MSHPLQQRIGGLRRKVRLLVVLHSFAWLVAAVLAVTVVLGLMDYLSRFAGPQVREFFSDAGIRVICSLAVVAVLALFAFRFAVRAVRSRFRDLDLALRIEERFPELKDRLSSVVQFLGEQEDDPHAGSASLRRAVITQTAGEIDELPLESAAGCRPTLRALAVAAGVCLVAGLLFALDPPSSRLALIRLAVPWDAPAWPQENHLHFRGPLTRAALGERLALEIVDRQGAPLPDEIRLIIQYEGDSLEQVTKVRPAGDSVVHQLKPVSRPFRYRAEGGDDTSMPWFRLEVVEPPRLESLAVKVHPPAYANWPTADSEKLIRALLGTRVEFRGASTKPLKRAALELSSGKKFPAVVTGDGYEFRLSAEGEKAITVREMATYRFRLEDEQDFVGFSDSFDIRPVADAAPTVSIDQPEEDLYLTAKAVVPLAVTAQDDLALKNVQLVFRRSDKSEQEDATHPLYAGPPRAPRQEKGLASRSLGELKKITHRWELADLKLPEGAQLTFYATAGDYKPQLGQSPARRITIISRDEVEDLIAERQAFILRKLAEILEDERKARSQVNDVQIQLQQVGQVQKADADRLHGAEMIQQGVNNALASKTEGVAGHIDRLLAHLENNRIDSPDIQKRMAALRDEIGRLDREHLANILDRLNDAHRAAEDSLQSDENKSGKKLDDKSPVNANVDAAARHQDAVIAALEKMLGDMAQWDNYNRFSREISSLRRDHDDLTSQTGELGKKTLARDFKDLTPQQQADLKKLAKRQLDLARRFDVIQQRMARMKGELDKDDKDPLAAGVLSDALHHSRSKGISGQMRAASGAVDRNQMGQARQTQNNIGEMLKEMSSILANRREKSLARLVKKLKEAEDQLRDLLDRQKRLRKQMKEAAANPDEEQRKRELKRLVELQRKLQQETERFARKLRRLEAQKAGRSAGSAAQRMARAGGQAGEGNNKKSGESQEKALKDLEQAGHQLAQRRQQAEQDLALEQLAKIEDSLAGLKQRQQTVLADTRRLEDILRDKGDWDRGQKDSVRLLSRQQTHVMEDTRELAEKLKAAEVFSMALSSAADEMDLAAGLLGRQKTGAATQEAEQNALHRFEQLLTSLKPDPAGDSKQNPGGDSGGGNQNAPGDGIPSLAQLKLLKLMQEEINSRTKKLHKELGKKETLTETEERRFALVSKQQGELARLALNLSKPTDEPPEDDPEALPDFSLDGLEDLKLDSVPEKKDAIKKKEVSDTKKDSD